jgi:hypothetical protein
MTAQPLPTASTHRHFVQFYEADEPLLNRNVGRFLWDGLLAGDALLVIATAERRTALSEHLARIGADVPMLVERKQLALLDAQEILDSFVVKGQPEWDGFNATISGAIAELHPRADGGISAYGEMVGLLWQAGARRAALILEDYWNRRLHDSGIRLFCGYPIDPFGREFQSEELEAIRRAHSNHVCGAAEDVLEQAIHRALDETLGASAGEVRTRMSDPDGAAVNGESSIHWLWQNMPGAAEGILAAARQHYRKQEPAQAA